MKKIIIGLIFIISIILSGCAQIPTDDKGGYVPDASYGLAEKCTMPAGIACMDFRYDKSTINITIQNGAGFDMTDTMVGIAGCSGAGTKSELKNGEKFTYIINCNLSPGLFKGDVIFVYKNKENGLSYETEGEIRLKVE